MAVSRVARMVTVLGAVTAATLGVSALASAGSGHHKPSAAVLLDRDPGKRVGGDTIVLTGNGEHALGVHDRPNFIVSLGSNEKIVGGGQDDELGALGQHDMIVAGHSGHELIHGGPHGTIVVGGSGHDLVIDNKPGTTIDLESPVDEVIATGHDDHVVCSGDSFHDVIYDNHSDTVNNTCHKHHDPVRPDSQAVATAASAAASANLARGGGGPVAHAAAVTGSGTNENPYTAPCKDPELITCTVDSFDSRTLSGYWANEYVPAYKCPSDHAYLLSAFYAPAGTQLPRGVEVEGLGPIGVSISATSPRPTSGSIGLATGTLTGYPNSSATNWDTFGAAHSYKVILHCTSSTSLGYFSK